MKLAHFISNFPKRYQTESYGKSLAAYNLCLELAHKGHDVSVFTVSDDNRDHNETINGINVYRFRSFLSCRSERFSYNILYKSLKYDFDIVHLHSGISMATAAGYIYAIKKNKPLVITWHGDSVREHGRYSGLIPGMAAQFYKIFMANTLLSRSDVIISPSKTYINESRFLRDYKEKVLVIPNGINLNQFEICYSKEDCRHKLGLKSKYIILFVGTLYPLKGPQILLEAIPKIIKHINDITFLFVGGGDVDSYKNMSYQNGIDRYVKFTGYISEELKPLYYTSSDIFCLPSVGSHEIFGIVNLEAMACGIPIVASRIGGVPDLVKNGENGLLIQPQNSNELAEAITYLLMNETIRNKMGINAREKVGAYSWNKIAFATEKLYRELCG